MGQVKMDGYVTVAERIEKFFKKYPEGSLKSGTPWVIESNGKSFVCIQTRAYRSPDDLAPSCGTAWEPIPGRTNFTRDSEVMNAETSAAGRAIALLGFEVKAGVASAEEMAGQAKPSSGMAAPKPAFVDPLYRKIKSAKDAGLLDVNQLKLQLVAYGIENPKGTKGDLARLPVGQAASLERWVDSQVKA